MIEYVPSFIGPAIEGLPNPGSSWNGLEKILPAIIRDFKIDPIWALEFGVEGGLSTAALRHFFRHVVAVDHFLGDQHSGIKPNARASWRRKQRERLREWPNIKIRDERVLYVLDVASGPSIRLLQPLPYRYSSHLQAHP